MFKYVTLLLCMTFLFSYCKKEQPPLSQFNENCDCSHEITARFKIEELSGQFSNPSIITETDTAFAFKNIHFYALEDNADYTWYIGTEVLHEQSVYRYFPGEFEFSEIPIKLVVEKEPHYICFPEDDGVDSLHKTLTLSSSDQINYFFGEPNYRFEGDFRFFSNVLNDSIDIRIGVYDSYENPNWVIGAEHFELIDLTHNGILFGGPDTTRYKFEQSLNYREITLNAVVGGHLTNVLHTISGEVSLDLRPIENMGNETSNALIGRKLN